MKTSLYILPIMCTLITSFSAHARDSSEGQDRQQPTGYYRQDGSYVEQYHQITPTEYSRSNDYDCRNGRC